jgi:hypothetical protein
MKYSDPCKRICKRIRWEINTTYFGALLNAHILKVVVKRIPLLIHVKVPAKDSVQPGFNYVPRHAGRIFVSFFFEGLHKSDEEIQVWLTLDKNEKHFTWKHCLNTLVTNVNMGTFGIKFTTIYVVGMVVLVPWNTWPLILQLFYGCRVKPVY